MLCVLFLMTGCGIDNYETQLPNGFKLVCKNSYTTLVCPPEVDGDLKGKKIPLDVARIDIKGSVVYGFTKYSPHLDTEENSDENPYDGHEKLGWMFILDTQTGEFLNDMRMKEFEAELVNRKLAKKNYYIQMHHPSRF